MGTAYSNTVKFGHLAQEKHTLLCWGTCMHMFILTNIQSSGQENLAFCVLSRLAESASSLLARQQHDAQRNICKTDLEAVQIIAGNWVPHVRHMHPDLVRAPCERCAAQQAARPARRPS